MIEQRRLLQRSCERLLRVLMGHHHLRRLLIRSERHWRRRRPEDASLRMRRHHRLVHHGGVAVLRGVETGRGGGVESASFGADSNKLAHLFHNAIVLFLGALTLLGANFVHFLGVSVVQHSLLSAQIFGVLTLQASAFRYQFFVLLQQLFILLNQHFHRLVRVNHAHRPHLIR